MEIVTWVPDEILKDRGRSATPHMCVGSTTSVVGSHVPAKPLHCKPSQPPSGRHGNDVVTASVVVLSLRVVS